MPSALYSLSENERAFIYACCEIQAKAEKKAYDKAKG
nr:MAG TPA: hypothetical protein [Caudoviricetes sp.]